jgi:hypothetical protein
MVTNDLGKFNQELSSEKTRIIRFHRFDEGSRGSFDFLGFEFRWGRSRRGKTLVKRRTSRKKFRQALANFTSWCRQYRRLNIRLLRQKEGLNQ